jgi:folate-binding protein YgfZ
MSDKTQCKLDHLGLLLLSGPDAIKFLQGQCTQDVSKLSSSKPLHGAFCTAKGRAITNVWFLKFNTQTPTIGILCHQSSASALQKHLAKYLAFFRGTTLTYEPGRFHGYGFYGSSDLLGDIGNLLSSEDSHIVSDWAPCRALAFLDSKSTDFAQALSTITELKTIEVSKWQIDDIREKRLWLSSDQIERWIPQNFSLDDLDGISFTKGCYTGQEVVARLHYKGQSKKRLFTLYWDETQYPDVKNIFSDGKNIGEIIESSTFNGKSYALAILKADQAEQVLFADENQQFEIQLLH